MYPLFTGLCTEDLMDQKIDSDSLDGPVQLSQESSKFLLGCLNSRFFTTEVDGSRASS